MKNRVVHFEIQADNLERARDFYQKAFGWKIEKWVNPEGQSMTDYWMIMTGNKDTPGIDGGMYMRPKDSKVNTYYCTIEVDDIDEAMAEVEKNGGKILNNKMEMKGLGWFANASDTEGNLFALMQSTMNPDMEMDMGM